MDWMIKGLIPDKARDFLFSRDIKIGSGAHPVSYSKGTNGMKVTTHFYLVLRLRICTAILLLPLCAFVACI
jgi:hypothetical protein